LKAPKTGDSHEKKFEGKEYVYCPHHRGTKWVLKSGHVGGCRNDPKHKEGDVARAPTAKEVVMARALASVMEDTDANGVADNEDDE
jgi:hypothetical protein